jgi:hypothetical protein
MHAKTLRLELLKVKADLERAQELLPQCGLDANSVSGARSALPPR